MNEQKTDRHKHTQCTLVPLHIFTLIYRTHTSLTQVQTQSTACKQKNIHKYNKNIFFISLHISLESMCNDIFFTWVRAEEYTHTVYWTSALHRNFTAVPVTGTSIHLLLPVLFLSERRSEVWMGDVWLIVVSAILCQHWNITTPGGYYHNYLRLFTFLFGSDIIKRIENTQHECRIENTRVLEPKGVCIAILWKCACIGKFYFKYISQCSALGS